MTARSILSATRFSIHSNPHNRVSSRFPLTRGAMLLLFLFIAGGVLPPASTPKPTWIFLTSVGLLEDAVRPTHP